MTDNTAPTTSGPIKRKPGRPAGSGHKKQLDELEKKYDALVARVEAIERRYAPIGGKFNGGAAA